MNYTREDEELAHMPSKVKTAFLKLQKLGCPVKIWWQTDPNYMDYRGYFWISTEETSSWEWLDYYSTALVCGSEKLREILDKADLYFEWENPAIAGVYDA